MEQERFMVIDNQKGVIIPLQADKTMSLEKFKELEIANEENSKLDDKISRIQLLIKAFVKQSIKDTIKEYNLQLTEELKEYERNEMKRWEKLEENDSKRWDKLEERMEEHFKTLDKSIRRKQDESKRKKHSIL